MLLLFITWGGAVAKACVEALVAEAKQFLLGHFPFKNVLLRLQTKVPIVTAHQRYLLAPAQILPREGWQHVGPIRSLWMTTVIIFHFFYFTNVLALFGMVRIFT